MGSGSAGPMSLASLGFQVAGDVMKTTGQVEADEYQSARLKRAAEYGRLAAEQTGAQMTERLVDTLGHIDATQAARHVDPTSPSAVAVRDREEYVGTRAKTIAVDNLMAQAQQNE